MTPIDDSDVAKLANAFQNVLPKTEHDYVQVQALLLELGETLKAAGRNVRMINSLLTFEIDRSTALEESIWRASVTYHESREALEFEINTGMQKLDAWVSLREFRWDATTKRLVTGKSTGVRRLIDELCLLLRNVYDNYAVEIGRQLEMHYEHRFPGLKANTRTRANGQPVIHVTVPRTCKGALPGPLTGAAYQGVPLRVERESGFVDDDMGCHD